MGTKVWIEAVVYIVPSACFRLIMYLYKDTDVFCIVSLKSYKSKGLLAMYLETCSVDKGCLLYVSFCKGYRVDKPPAVYL